MKDRYTLDIRRERSEGDSEVYREKNYAIYEESDGNKYIVIEDKDSYGD